MRYAYNKCASRRGQVLLFASMLLGKKVMARHLRIEFAGAPYHVKSEARNKT